MTNKELQEILAKLPPDAKIVHFNEYHYCLVRNAHVITDSDPFADTEELGFIAIT